MTTRTYDLSENVVPRQGEEAIADTPSSESPSATTDEKRGEEDVTDPTSLDDNPENEDSERTPDDRTDVTSLAARRARAKNSTPIPKLSTTEFSNVLKWIDRTATNNPRADFGKVVVTGVREFSYKANKNALNVLAAVVPNLLKSGNFDINDRESLVRLYQQIVAQRKQADGDPSGMSKMDPAGGGAPPVDPSDAQAGGSTMTIPSDPGGIGNALGDVAGGLGEGLSNAGSGLADAAGQAVSDVGAGLGQGVQNGMQDMGLGGLSEGVGQISDAVGQGVSGIGQGIDTIQNNGAPPADPSAAGAPPAGAPPADPTGGATGAPPPIGSPNDPGAQNLAHVKRGRSVRANGNSQGQGQGVLHFDTGDPNSGPVPVQHLQDHGDGTSMVQNEQGQPEPVNNEDLYHDPQLTMPVTQPQPKDQIPPSSPASPHTPSGGGPAGNGSAGPPTNTSPQQQPPGQPPQGQPPQGSPPASPPKPPLSDDSTPDRGSSPDKTPDKKDDNSKKTQNPYNSRRRRAGDETNADGADPENVREENKDNTVNPNDSFNRDPGKDLDDNKTSALSRHRRRADDNMDAAKKDTDDQDVEKPIVDTSDRAQQTQYDRGEYDQNGPLLTDPDKSTDQNWPPKASAVDAIRLADMYVDFGLIAPEQKYQVVAGFEKMNGFIVKDRLKVLTAVAETRRSDKNRSLVPQSNGKMPSMGRGSSLKEASKNSDFDHFLAL